MFPTTTFLAVAWLSLTAAVDARTAAVPAIQKLSSRAEYQGGWALALEGSASTTCPADAPVLCSSDLVTPGCCPTGQTCINGAGADANYCCPTSTSLAFFPFPPSPHHYPKKTKDSDTLPPYSRRLQHRCAQFPPMRQHNLEHVPRPSRRLLLLRARPDSRAIRVRRAQRSPM
jgi:hypothetical protein